MKYKYREIKSNHSKLKVLFYKEDSVLIKQKGKQYEGAVTLRKQELKEILEGFKS